MDGTGSSWNWIGSSVNWIGSSVNWIGSRNAPLIWIWIGVDRGGSRRVEIGIGGDWNQSRLEWISRCEFCEVARATRSHTRVTEDLGSSF